MWHPQDDGLSVSGLNLWLQDRFAFKVRYLEGYEEVQSFAPPLAYGNLVQAGIEGYIQSGRQKVGLIKFIRNEHDRLVEEHGTMEEIEWWTHLAIHQADLFVSHYENDPVLPLTSVTTSERNIRVECPLPSGRSITLNGYLDGEGKDLVFENKVRGRWSPEKIAQNIHLDLQVQYYLMASYCETGEVPKQIWYQHQLRVGGWGSKGPRKKKTETDMEHLERIKIWMSENPDEVFYRYLFQPTPTDVQRFAHACLYPMLEAFLDWFEYQEKVRLGEPAVNRFDWMSPYGQYNPFVEGTIERFRDYRISGQPLGLRKRGS
tara:strand:- start:263 stop:1216 length:954 start_codon:yes stop_codon:yes gene_type:complete